MANSLIQQAGGQPQKQPRYVPIHIARAQAGLVTNRAVLHDISIGIYGRFYGGQPDVLLGGSNIEISPQQTWKHRPGCSFFLKLPTQCLTSYPYFNPDGSVILYMDTATGVYTWSNFIFTGLVFTKSPGAGQTSFLQIGNTLYMANGVDNIKIINGKVYQWASAGPTTAPVVVVDSIGAGAAASIPWAASTVFTTMGLLKDTNGNMQQLVSVNADGSNSTSTVIGTSGVGEPVWSNTSGGTVTEVSTLQWTCYGPVGNWVAGATYTNASNPGTLTNPSAIFDHTSGNLFLFITGGAGTGTAGNNRPNFVGVPLGGHVGDHGFKWFNIGPPTTWKPGHAYGQYGVSGAINNRQVVEPTTPQAAGYGTANAQTVFLQASGGGTSDSSHTGPQWQTTQTTPITRDGQLNYQFLGSATRANSTTYIAWQAGTPFFNVIYDGANLQVCLVGGLSGGGAPSWQTTYGAITIDGTVQWVCVGPSVSWAASTKWFLPPNGFTPPVANVNPYGGASILDSNQNVESVTSSGKSNTVAPTWATTVGTTTTDSGVTWTLTALAASFKGTTALAFTKGYGYAYAWKSRSATDFYVKNAPPGQAGALGPPTGSGSGGITTASPVFSMPVASNAGAVMQVSGAWPTDTQYDTVVVSRSVDGFQLDGPYLEDTEIACPAPVNGVYQGTWSYYDSLPDTQLNELVEADVIGENTPPPTGLQNIALHMNRIWGNVGNIVQASSGPDIPPGNGNGYEGWAPANTYPVEAPVNKNIPTQSGLLSFTTSSVFIIAGGPSATQFFPWRIAKGIGLNNPNAVDVIGGEIYMFTADARLISFQPGVGHTEPSRPIANLIENFNPANVYITEHAAGSDASAIYLCEGTTGWYRLEPHATPGFISADQPVWSPHASIVGGCTGAQSQVITGSGLRYLLVYQSDGTILSRNISVAQDNNNNFTCDYTVGSIVVAHPGQLADLGFVTFEFSNRGNPDVSFLLNEIGEALAAQPYQKFQTFLTSVYDPPLVYGTTQAPASYSPNRYYFQQTVVPTSGVPSNPPPLLVRHLQLHVSYPAENFFHELYSFCINGALYAES